MTVEMRMSFEGNKMNVKLKNEEREASFMTLTIMQINKKKNSCRGLTSTTTTTIVWQGYVMCGKKNHTKKSVLVLPHSCIFYLFKIMILNSFSHFFFVGVQTQKFMTAVFLFRSCFIVRVDDGIKM